MEVLTLTFVSEDLQTLLQAHTFSGNAALSANPSIRLNYEQVPLNHTDDGEIVIKDENRTSVVNGKNHRKESYRIITDVNYSITLLISEVIDATSNTITFANVDPDTITRASGSWVDDGFVVGDRITIEGTTSNDTTTYYTLTVVTALVLTVSDDLSDETFNSGDMTIETIVNTAILNALLSEIQSAFDAENKLPIVSRTLSNTDYYWSLLYNWSGGVMSGTIRVFIDSTKRWIPI